MADNVEGIHDKLNGDLDAKVAEINQLMLSMAATDRSPKLSPLESSTTTTVPTITSMEAASVASTKPKPSRSESDTYSHPFTPEMTPEMVGSDFSPQSSRALSPGNISVNGFDVRRSSDIIPVNDQYRLPSYYNEPPPEYKSDRRSVVSDLSRRLNVESTQTLSVDTARSPSLGSLGIQSLSPVMLPPPILTPEQDTQDMRPTNVSLADTPAAAPSKENVRAVSTVSQQDMFERRLFGDAATLCDA